MTINPMECWCFIFVSYCTFALAKVDNHNVYVVNKRLGNDFLQKTNQLNKKSRVFPKLRYILVIVSRHKLEYFCG